MKRILLSIFLSLFLTIKIIDILKNPQAFFSSFKKVFIKPSPSYSYNSSFSTSKPTPFFPLSTPTVFLKTPTPVFDYFPTSKVIKTTPTKINFPTSTPIPTPTPFSCPKTSSNYFSSVEVLKLNPKPLSQRDDLTLPPMVPVSAKMDVFYEKVFDPDPKIPVLNEIFNPPRRPRFVAGYQSTREVRGSYVAEVEILEVETTPAEALRFPYTAYDIGGGNRAMVLHVGEKEITFKITREDDVVYGYTLYFDNLCPDPNLKNLYLKANLEGRRWLPAIKEGQIFGWAKGKSMKIGIRDTGTFLDIRQIDPQTHLGFWR